jgi:DNA adenine methylase
MFSRVGGKSKLKNYIISKFPKHKIYVEPFVGGGSVFFSKEPVNINIINDKDIEIYNMYRDMKAVGEKMINKNFIPNRDKFNKLLKQTKFNSKADRLYRNLYISMNSFSGNRKGFGGDKYELLNKNADVGKKYKNMKWKNFLNDNNVKIFNKDFSTIIKKYDSPETLFYLDPPYSKSTGDYDVGGIEPIKVFDALQDIKGKFILSYDVSPEIKKLFNKYKKEIVKTVYEVSGNRQEGIKEYLITNF